MANIVTCFCGPCSIESTLRDNNCPFHELKASQLTQVVRCLSIVWISFGWFPLLVVVVVGRGKLVWKMSFKLPGKLTNLSTDMEAHRAQKTASNRVAKPM